MLVAIAQPTTNGVDGHQTSNSKLNFNQPFVVSPVEPWTRRSQPHDSDYPSLLLPGHPVIASSGAPRAILAAARQRRLRPLGRADAAVTEYHSVFAVGLDAPSAVLLLVEGGV